MNLSEYITISDPGIKYGSPSPTGLCHMCGIEVEKRRSFCPECVIERERSRSRQFYRNNALKKREEWLKSFR